MYQIEFLVDETEECIDVIAMDEAERDQIISLAESRNYDLLSVHRFEAILGMENFQSYVGNQSFNNGGFDGICTN